MKTKFNFGIRHDKIYITITVRWKTIINRVLSSNNNTNKEDSVLSMSKEGSFTWSLDFEEYKHETKHAITLKTLFLVM